MRVSSRSASERFARDLLGRLEVALVAVVRAGHHLDVVEELEQEDVPQRRLGVLDVVQLPHLEVVLALDHARVRPPSVHRLHLVVKEHRLDARDLALIVARPTGDFCLHTIAFPSSPTGR